MQTINMYLRADSITATQVDEENEVIFLPPAITRGTRCNLVLHILNPDGTAYEGLGDYAAWDFVLANDWDASTAPQLRIADGIVVADHTITIPLLDTNTPELAAVLGSEAEVILGTELAGMETGETIPGFLLQFEVRIRNRRGTAGL